VSGRTRHGACLGVLATLCFLLAAQSASATFHLMRIREVYPGSAEDPQAEYVELQMFESGQQFVGGHFLRTYGADGTLAHSDSLAADVPSGASQRTVLLATPEAELRFGLQADESCRRPGSSMAPAAPSAGKRWIASHGAPSAARRPRRPGPRPTHSAFRTASPCVAASPRIARPCSRKATTATTAPPRTPLQGQGARPGRLARSDPGVLQVRGRR
jgi:hypothetical protein